MSGKNNKKAHIDKLKPCPTNLKMKETYQHRPLDTNNSEATNTNAQP